MSECTREPQRGWAAFSPIAKATEEVL